MGAYDGWSKPTQMRRFGDDGWWVAELFVPPGEYGYLVVEEGQGRIDRYNPLTTWREGDDLEVSLLLVEDCRVPRLEVDQVVELDAGTLQVDARFVPGVDGVRLDPTAVVVSIEDRTIEQVGADSDSGRIQWIATDLTRGKHVFSLDAKDTQGVAAPTRRAVGWTGPVARDHEDQIVYQVVVDRFRGDGAVGLMPPPTPGARAGGTLDGVRAEIEAGTFEALGVSTLWLSPVYLAPDEAREGLDGHLYEGYHGYWALQSREVDPRLGGAEALRVLVTTAHEHGLRVLLDFVPNHLYEDNPRARDDAWFHNHEPACICGTPSCPWDDFIETCWFAPYLPDLRFENPDVMQTTVDDALWWHETFGTDGFRIDAVPMMPRAATRRILHAVRDAEGPISAGFHVGEIFTGPGSFGTEVIRFHLGPDGLDAAFDFPLMWAIRDAVATEMAGFEAVEAVLTATESAIAGSGSSMARMIGNHDTTRFASLVAGDADADGWGSTPAEQPNDPQVYARQGLGLGLLLTLPGIPVLYYGDTIGLAGGHDPDNRRVLPTDEALTSAQRNLRDRVRRLGTLRRCHPALRDGARIPFAVGPDRYGFARVAPDGRDALVFMSRRTEPSEIVVPAALMDAGIDVGWYKDALTAERFDLQPDVSIPMAPLSLRVLVPEADPCG